MADPDLIAVLRQGSAAWNGFREEQPRRRSFDLSGAFLDGARLRGVNLAGADLDHASLRGADLSGADLSHAFLEGADLTTAILFDADLRGAVLVGAHLAGADLRSADLRDADLGAGITARTPETFPPRPPIRLTMHPPAERPEADDAGMVASEVEGLLAWVERFVADEANPEDLRREVEVRRNQLIDELQLVAEGKGSSAVLTGLAAALLPIVRPAPADDPLGAAADEVADAAIALGRATSADEIVAAGEEVVAALDHVGDEMARYGVDDVREAALRSAGAWFEQDARGHLNAFVTAARERALPAGTGVAGGVATSWMGGPPWLVVTVVALGLLRARFPWIFRPRPPEDPP